MDLMAALPWLFVSVPGFSLSFIEFCIKKIKIHKNTDKTWHMLQAAKLQRGIDPSSIVNGQAAHKTNS